VARPSIIAEALRTEQDPESPIKNTVVELLDSLDQASVQDAKNRDLFRFILSAASQPLLVLTREQLLPARNLWAPAPSSLQETLSQTSKEKDCNQFIVDAMEMKPVFTQREHLEALEVLLVLLSDRIQGGVHQSDGFHDPLRGSDFRFDQEHLPIRVLGRQEKLTACWEAALVRVGHPRS
jgi:hypothetical protein